MMDRRSCLQSPFNGCLDKHSLARSEEEFSCKDSFTLKTTPSFYEDVFAPPHPSQRSALPSIEQWRNVEGASIIITNDPRAETQVVATDANGSVPLNVPVSIETSTFVGHICNIIKGCPGTPATEFKGSRLLGKSIIQGRFKTPTTAKDLWVGQELLNKPLLPTSFQRLVFTAAAKIFGSTYKVMVEGDGDAVGYLNPLLAISSVINVSLPGQQPDLTAAVEDMRLLDSSLVDKSGQPLPSAQRQRHFDKPSNLQDVVFDPQYVYTFVICQSIMDMPAYRLKLGAFINLDLCPVLNGQPLQLMCKNVQTDEKIMSLLVWHKNLNHALDSSMSRLASCSSLDSSLFNDSRTSSSLCANSASSSNSSNSSSSSDRLAGTSVSSSRDSIDSADDAATSGSLASSVCGSDYHSCVDEEDFGLWDPEQLFGPSSSAHQHTSGGAVRPPQLLEMAFSAPANFHYHSAGHKGKSGRTLEQLQLHAAAVNAAQNTAEVPQGAGNGAHGSSSKSLKGRKAAHRKAVAAVAAAARRLAERLRGRPKRQRRLMSCPGDAL